jgi:hypothetical protein
MKFYDIASRKDASLVLTCSSFLFIIPSVYAYKVGLYYYTLILIITSLVSANYWRNPEHGLRRNLDIMLAKTTFVIFFIDGIYFVKTNIVLAYLILIAMVYCFFSSGCLSSIRYTKWYYYHASFHFLVMSEQMLIIYNKSLN